MSPGYVHTPFTFTDQTGHTLHFARTPLRIVSLVPSITAFLCDIGLQQHICGVTKFCIHPAGVRKTAQVVGGTKNYSVDKIKALQPDVVIANKEENVRESIEELRKYMPVYVSDITTLEQSLDMMRQLGGLFGCENTSDALIHAIQEAFDAYPRPQQSVPTAYFIWRRPYMSVNAGTFIHDILQRLGFRNVFAGREGRYPEISVADLQQASPRLILLSSEPYPFGEKHIDEFRRLLPGAEIRLVDGECYSWYGSSVKRAPAYTLQWMQSAEGI